MGLFNRRRDERAAAVDTLLSQVVPVVFQKAGWVPGGRMLADDVAAVLCVRDATATRPLSEEQLATHPEDQWWQAARENLKQHLMPMGVIAPPGVEHREIVSESGIGASAVQLFPEITGAVAGIDDHGHGHVVAIPEVNTVLLLPLRASHPTESLAALSTAAVERFSGTDPVARRVSPWLYWVRGQQLTQITHHVEGRIELDVPAEMPIASASGQHQS